MIKILNNPDELKPVFIPQAGKVKEQPWVWLMLIALAVLLFFRVLSDNLVVKFDDAYMYIRYANHILAGYGHVWNAGDAQVYGSTSMFYSMIIVFLKAVTRLSDSHVLIFASGTLGMLAIAMLAKISSGLLGLGSYLKWLSIYLAIFVFTTPYMYHSNSGMDTTLSLLFNSLLIFAVLKFLMNDGVKDLFVVIALSFLTISARPDNVICAILFPFLAILFFGSNPEKRIAAFLTSVLFLLLVDAGLKYLLLNDPLPLAFYAKRNGFYEGYIGQYQWNQMVYILMFLASCIPFVFFAPHVRDRFWYKAALVFLFPVLLTAGYYATVQQIMGHFSRYYFPFIPYVAVFSALILRRHLNNRAEKPANIRHRLFAVVIAYAVLIGLYQILPQWYTQRMNAVAVAYSPATQYTRPALTDLPRLELWDVFFLLEDFSRKLPAHTKMAMSEYGYLGAKAWKIDVIDTIGLHDRQIAHNGFDEHVFFAREPDIIWFPHKHYTKLNSTIVDNVYFQSHYEYYPDAFLYGFAINKTSKHYAVISRLFDQLWENAYGNLDRSMYLAHVQRNSEH